MRRPWSSMIAKEVAPRVARNLRHLIQDVVEIVVAGPLQIDGDAEDTVEPFAARVLVDERARRPGSGSLRSTCRTPNTGGGWRCLDSTRRRSAGDFRRIPPDLDGIDVGSLVRADPGWQPIGAGEHDRSAARRCPAEEEFRIGIAREGKRDEVVCLVGRIERLAILFGAVEDQRSGLRTCRE